MSANKATPPIPTVRDSPVGPEVMKQVNHVFVLMLENRSFDSLFGFLYEPTGTTAPSLEAPPPFHGLLFPSPKAPTCEPPAQAQEGEGPRYSPHYGNKLKSDSSATPTMAWIPRDPSSQFREGESGGPGAFFTDEDAKTFLDQAHWPPVNPGEHHDHVARQLYGVESTKEAKWNDDPPMSGFIDDYAHVWREEHKINDGNRAKDIMQSVHPSLLPVMTRLAHEYAVSDYWFASVPTQTWPNRLFSLAATSHGLVYNDDNSKLKERIEHITKYPVRSVFSHMDEFHGGPASQAYDRAENGRIPIWNAKEASQPSDPNAEAATSNPSQESKPKDLPWSWSVYSHTLGYDMVSSLLGALFAEEHVVQKQYRSIEQLSADARNDKQPLPAFSLIEPAFFPYKKSNGEIQLHNDLHPAETVEALTDYIERPPVWEADRLVLKVYEALFGEGVEQSRKDQTLFIVLFDEHGGCYDHIPPPATVHPHHPMPKDLPSEFAFQRLGVRLPALFISPLIQRGTILRPPRVDVGKAFDHTSVIRSLRERWTVQVDPSSPSAIETPALTRRDASAPSFWHVLNSGNCDQKGSRDPETIIDDLKNSLEVLDKRHKAAELQLKLKRDNNATFIGSLWNRLSDLGKGIIISGMASAGPLKKAGLPFPASGSRSVDSDGVDLTEEARRHFEQGACPLKKAGFPFPSSESRFLDLDGEALTAEARRHFEVDIANWNFGAKSVLAESKATPSSASTPPFAHNSTDPAPPPQPATNATNPPSLPLAEHKLVRATGGKDPTAAPRRIALLVGINNYPNIPLKGCLEDALAMKSVLEQYGFTTTVLQTDEECSKESILTHLWAKGDEMKENDVFVFYFSGHGATAFDPNAPSGTGCTDSLVALFKNFAEREKSFILDSEIDRWLASLSAGLPILIFDCCHAGGASRDISLQPSSSDADHSPSADTSSIAPGSSETAALPPLPMNQPTASESSRDRFAGDVTLRSSSFEALLSKEAKARKAAHSLDRRPHVMLAAATDEQVAKEQSFGNATRGVFTEALEYYLKLLHGKEDTGDYSYADLLPVVQQRVKLSAPHQTPVFEARTGLNRQIFGLKMLPVTHTVRLLHAPSNQHGTLLAAGSVHGISPESVWTVARNALGQAVTPAVVSDAPLAPVSVKEPGALVSELKLGPNPTIDRAWCTERIFNRLIHVALDPAGQSSSKISSHIHNSNCIDPAPRQNQEDAMQILLKLERGRVCASASSYPFRNLEDYPQKVSMLSLPLDDIFLGNLDAFAWYHGLLASVPDTPESSGYTFKKVPTSVKPTGKLSISLQLGTPNSMPWILAEDAELSLNIKNTYEDVIQVTILSLNSDASVVQILPTPGAEMTTRLAGGAQISVNPKVMIPLAADRMKNGDTQLTLRFILSGCACDSSFLMQPGMQSFRDESFVRQRERQFGVRSSGPGEKDGDQAEHAESLSLPLSVTMPAAVATVKFTVRPGPSHRELTCRYSLAEDARWKSPFSQDQFRELVTSLRPDDRKLSEDSNSSINVVLGASESLGILDYADSACAQVEDAACSAPPAPASGVPSPPPAPPLRVSLVLVHGCTSDYDVTWSDGKFDAKGKPSGLGVIGQWIQFLADVLSQALQPKLGAFIMRVLRINHSGAAGFDPKGSLAATAQAIAEDLSSKLDDKTYREQLVFCSHGTGALLLSHLLHLPHDTSKSVILQKVTMGVICLGVPDWSNITSNLHVLNTVLGWRTALAKIGDFVEAFKNQARTQWKDKGFPSEIPTAYFYADCAGPERDVFVPTLRVAGDLPIPTLDYLSLPKIGSADDALAKGIIGKLNEWIKPWTPLGFFAFHQSAKFVGDYRFVLLFSLLFI